MTWRVRILAHAERTVGWIVHADGDDYDEMARVYARPGASALAQLFATAPDLLSALEAVSRADKQQEVALPPELRQRVDAVLAEARRKVSE